MMKMMRTKISKPNYNLAEEKAREFIEKLEVKELPIKLISYKKVFHDLEIKKYSWYSKKMGLSMSEVFQTLGSEDGCCVFNERNGKYRILYNDTIDNEGRKRWTLAHELGHYALKHHGIYGNDILQRSSINDELYEILEKEANCFARNLLAPPHVIFHLDTPTPEVIQEICNISFEAALNTFKFIRTGAKEYGIGYSKDFAEKLGFKKFLFNANNRYYCRVCGCNFVLKNPSYCPCCGNPSITKSIYKLGDEFDMKYFGIQVDQGGKAITCPLCQNEELSGQGDYCKICGTQVINKCDNTYNSRGYLEEEGCGSRLEGNARYCSNCGNPSTFFISGLLKPWNEENENLYPFPKNQNLF